MRPPRGILALSLAAVLLAATASTASAATSLNGDRDFGDQQVGTTSPAQRFILLVTSGDFNPSISVSGDYAQTNDCPPTLSDPPGVAAAGCTIKVTFTPTAFGPRTGTLSAGPGGPTAALTGNGCSPPGHCPLTLFSVWKRSTYAGGHNVLLRKKLPFYATTNNDTTLVATGREIEKTTKQLAAGEKTKVKTKLKHLKRLREKAKHDPPKVKVKFTATDEFGQTATAEFTLRLWPQDDAL